jgi:hypothetical protein
MQGRRDGQFDFPEKSLSGNKSPANIQKFNLRTSQNDALTIKYPEPHQKKDTSEAN